MISELLKEETKSLHAQTEKSLNAKRIFSPDFTLEEYQEILCILYAAHVALESRLDTIKDPLLFEFYQKHYQPQYPLIKKDLDHLGATDSAKGYVTKFNITDTQAIGVIYVLKGSSMGAKFINKQLENTTAEWPRFSGEFYSVSASQTMEDWKNFCSSLENLNFSRKEIEEVVEGAREAFRTFIRSSEEVNL